MMKNILFKTLMGLALVMLSLSGCKDGFYDDYKAQAVDNHGKTQNSMIYTAVTSSGQNEFLAYAVDATTTETEIGIIPVVLSGTGTAKEDIHVKFVLALDSLDSYNTANETDYIMPGDVGTPAFTLLDEGVATIAKGSSVGYLKIKTIPNDYFVDQAYAFPYKIESIQESGYTLSANHNFGIVSIVPKNAYDGKYHAVGALVGHPTLSGPIDYSGFTMTSVSQYAVTFNSVFGTNGKFGVEVKATIDPNTNLVTLVATANSSAPLAFADADNHYDPATKTFKLHFGWGTRDETLTLTYTGPR
ncbi:MAG TPA: DUF1735 domain-containing protein [Cyclobacteriaceae bacterium]